MNILKSRLLFLCLAATLTCHAQKTIGELKAFADQFIKNNFSTFVNKQIKIEGYFGQDADRSKKEFLGGDCFEDRNKRVEFELLAFICTLYSKRLNYKFLFRIIFDSSL